MSLLKQKTLVILTVGGVAWEDLSCDATCVLWTAVTSSDEIIPTLPCAAPRRTPPTQT